MQTLYADGSTTLARYDGAGQAVASTNALGRESRTTYDARGRKLTDTLPILTAVRARWTRIVTSYEYDDVGLMKQINPGRRSGSRSDVDVYVRRTGAYPIRSAARQHPDGDAL